MFWKKKSKKPEDARKALINKAASVAQSKREEIGDETLDAIRDAIARKENGIMAKARRDIIAADADKVRDHLKYMMRDDS